MKALTFVLLACSIPAICQDQRPSAIQRQANKTILLNLGQNPHVSEQELSRLFAKTCPNYTVTSRTEKYDYVLETSDATREVRSTAIYDSGGILVRSTGERSAIAIKEICHALNTSTLLEVVDAQNLTQTSDLRGAPSRPGIGGVADAIHGRRNTLTDNANLNVIVNGDHALLDCYEHHRGCTTIGPGKYYAEFDGDSMWIDYEMPVTREPKRNHYVIAGSW